MWDQSPLKSPDESRATRGQLRRLAQSARRTRKVAGLDRNT